MITRAELQRIAGREKIGLGVLEKDYVITEALRGLSAVKSISSAFIFKGGTALRKAYPIPYGFVSRVRLSGRLIAAYVRFGIKSDTLH